MKTRRIAILIALAVGLAQAGAYPGGTGQAAAGAAEKVSKDWKRIRTDHFEAVSNAPVEKVREILIQMEAFHRYLVTDLLALKTTSPVPTVVFIFKDAGAYSKFQPRLADGSRQKIAAAYFHQSADINHIVLPMKLEQVNPLRLIFHEYYHFVIQANFPEMPIWMKEGLAEFYSTYEVDPTSGQCNIGRPIDNHIAWLQAEKLLPLEQMFDPGAAATLMRSNDRRRMPLFYAQSWALVHYLMISKNTQRQPQLKAYLEAAKKGLPAAEAFQSAFGTTFADMQRELKAYANSELFMMRYSWDPEDLMASSTVEPLTEIEAEFLQGDLLARIGADADAEETLKRVLARAPSFAPAKVSLASVLIGKGRLSDAIVMLRPVAEGDAAAFRAHLLLAAAYAQGKLYEDSLREFQRAGAANDKSTAAWLGACMAAVNLGRPAESEAAMKRLQELEANPDWYRVRAHDAFNAGLYDLAVGDARAYIGKAGPGEETSPYMAFVGALALLRLGQAAESDQLLAEVRPALAEGSWPLKVMDFMQGRTEADKFLALATDVNERTEAHAYIGLKDSLAGRRDQALEHLRWVKENGSRNYVEYGMALAELKRLDAEVSQKPTIAAARWSYPPRTRA
jgi:tetratricopeptide (TPR) repeat protein